MRCATPNCPHPIILEGRRLCHNCWSERRYKALYWRREAAKRRAARRRERNKLAQQVLALANRQAQEAKRKTNPSRINPRPLQSKIRIGKISATKRGLVWDLSDAQVAEALRLGVCHYCLGPLPRQGLGLDRKDNKQGYVEGNVVACCSSCNKIKVDELTYEEMVVAMRAVTSLRRSQGKEK